MISMIPRVPRDDCDGCSKKMPQRHIIFCCRGLPVSALRGPATALKQKPPFKVAEEFLTLRVQVLVKHIPLQAKLQFQSPEPLQHLGPWVAKGLFPMRLCWEPEQKDVGADGSTAKPGRSQAIGRKSSSQAFSRGGW